MSTFTLATVYQILAREYLLGYSGTNTGAVATSLTDDSDFGGYGGSRGIEAGSAIIIDGGTRAGDIVRLSAIPKLNTGLATVDPSFGAALDSTSTFTIFPYPLRITGGGHGVRDAINEALAKFMFEKRIVPVTLAADGDMLSAATSSWTTSNSTLAKIVATFPTLPRALEVTATAASGYARTASIPVKATEPHYLEATGWIDVDGNTADLGTLILFDVTNSAALTLSESAISQFHPTLLVNPSVSITSTCKLAQVRLQSDANTDIIAWTDVILRSNTAARHRIQNRDVRLTAIGQVRWTTEDTWERRTWDEMHELDATPVKVDQNMWDLHLDGPHAGQALFYEEFYEPASLTAVTDTTTIDAEELAAVAAEILLGPMRSERRWALQYDKAAHAAAGAIDRHVTQNQTVIHRQPARRLPLSV